MQTLNYNVMNVLKSYLPNSIYFNLSATNNVILYTPITQSELQRRRCYIYLFPIGRNNYCYCYRHITCIKYMIKKGFDLYDDWNDFILEYAAEHGYIKIVKFLIEEIGLKISDEAVSASASKGHLHVLKYLVKQGINIHDIRNYGCWALKLSSVYGYMDVVKYLIEEIGLDINDIRSNDNYALKYASYNGHLHIVKYLIELGLTNTDIE